MNYNKTVCKCCPNTLSFWGEHAILELHNWRNIYLSLQYSVSSERTHPEKEGDKVYLNTRYKLVLAFWMLRLTIDGNTLKPASYAPCDDWDTREYDYGPGCFFWVPPAPWQKIPGIGAIGFDMSALFAGFSPDPDYEDTITLDVQLGLPYMGYLAWFHTWKPESRRAKEKIE